MTTKYDPAAVEKLATDLYRRAKMIVRICVAVFALLGLVGGYALGKWLWIDDPLAHQLFYRIGMGIICTLFGGGCGWSIGEALVSGMRLQAQIALGQKQIEENTRG